MRRRRATIPGMEVIAAVIHTVTLRYSCVLAVDPAPAKEACDDDEGYCEDASENDEPGDR
jgi:hypothetical protein